MSRVYRLALIELAALGPLATALVISLSLKILQIAPETKETSLALVTTAGAVAALVSNPVWGHLSDRTRSRFGRRRPWIVSGSLVGALSALLMLLAPGVGWLAAAWALGQIGYNAVLAALNAMLADQVPEQQRAKASGIFGAFGFLGLVPAMLIAAVFSDNLPVVMLAMPMISLVLVSVLCLFLPDAPFPGSVPTPVPGDPDSNTPGSGSMTSSRPVSSRPVSGSPTTDRGIGDVFRAFLFNPLRTPRFSLVWVQRCVMQFGYTIVGTFGLFYLIERLGMLEAEAVSLTSVATVAGAALNTAAAFACGYLASRRGNYGPFIVAATAAMAVSMLMKAYTGDLAVFWVSTAVAGFALGMYYAVDLALVMRTLPEDEKGKYLGIFNLAKTIPQSIAPALAPFALMIGGPDPVTGHDSNYASLYLVGTIAVLASLAVLPGLRPILRRAPEPSGTDDRDQAPESDPIPGQAPATAQPPGITRTPDTNPIPHTAPSTTPSTKDVTP